MQVQGESLIVIHTRASQTDISQKTPVLTKAIEKMHIPDFLINTLQISTNLKTLIFPLKLTPELFRKPSMTPVSISGKIHYP